MKKYLEKNIYAAFCERIEYVFSEFDHVFFSVSGGKDSSVTVQLASSIAQKMGRKFDVLFIDLEAQYNATIDHIYELKQLPAIDTFYHYCLPLENEDNPNSIFQPTWVPWAEKDREKWVREMPQDAITIDTVDQSIFQPGQEWEDLLKQFPKWLMREKGLSKIACIVSIRTDESMHRFRAIAFGKNTYKDIHYSTCIAKGVYNFYPVYDWRTEDIWGAVSKFDLLYNQVYEMMFKLGIGIHEQRICQPFGLDQRVSLNQWAQIEPETWHKVVNRVSGTNFGNIYAKTSLLGYNGTTKPDFMTWEEYAVFLLESLGMYSHELMMHYYRKISILFAYIQKEVSLQQKDIPENHKPGNDVSLSDWISWKRIAKTIEKNDYSCRGLQYGLTESDKQTLQQLKEKWGTLLGLEHYKTKEMINLAKELGYDIK